MLILLLGVLLCRLGTYMVIPILPIMLRLEAQLTLVQIGTVLAAIPIAFQFGGVLVRFCHDLWVTRGISCTGYPAEIKRTTRRK